MAKGGLAVTPGPVLLAISTRRHLGTIQLGDILAELVVSLGDGQSLDFLVACRRVHGHVKDTEVQLAEVEQGVVDVLGADQALNEVVRDSLRRLASVLGALLEGSLVLR